LNTQLSHKEFIHTTLEESVRREIETLDRDLEAAQARAAKLQQKAERRRDTIQALRASLAESERDMQTKLKERDEENVRLHESILCLKHAEEALVRTQRECRIAPDFTKSQRRDRVNAAAAGVRRTPDYFLTSLVQ
jgi:chromosome segregation ATPase